MPDRPARETADVCVYGATSGGITAAIAVARAGRSVLLVEPGRHLGGMTSGGLGWTDFGVTESIGGLSREFFRRVERHYADIGGMEQGPGWSHEPHVAEDIFRAWIGEYSIRVVFEHRLARVERDGTRIVAAEFDHAPPEAHGAPAPQAATPGALSVRAAMWIDATYEGDLMARAGVRSTTRREGRDEHGESIAGVRVTPVVERGTPLAIDPFVERGRRSSGLLPLVEHDDGAAEGSAHDAVQAFCFRLCLSQGDSRPVAPPRDYDPGRYELLGRWFEACGEAGIVIPKDDIYHARPGQQGHSRPIKICPLPRGKSDVNNGAPISIDHVGGGSTGYAEADWAGRHRIWTDHEDYTRGLLHFLGTDDRIPADLRREIGTWGLPRDEFTDTAGWPHQLYVRECRRLVGRHVMTQHDAESPAPVADCIGLGSYSLDSHLCRRLERDGRVVREGGFMHRIRGAYPIPYRSITPLAEDCGNLQVLFCLSSTHAAYSSLRMEPVLMILGESAAVAACLALEGRTSVQGIDVPRLVGRLRELGQVLDA